MQPLIFIRLGETSIISDHHKVSKPFKQMGETNSFSAGFSAKVRYNKTVNSCSCSFYYFFHFANFLYLLEILLFLLFSLDDTGCPSSQSVSPVKTPSDAGHSPISFCTGSDGDFSRKKFNAGTTSEGNTQLSRCKKETKTNLVKPGEYSIVPFTSLITLSNWIVHLQVSRCFVLCCLWSNYCW